MSNKNQPRPDLENLLRKRLGEFADQAPTTVVPQADLHLARVVDENTASTRGGTARRKVAAIGAAIIALGGGVVLTNIAATADDDSSANTPEEAVRAFVTAVEQRDVIGAIDTLDPAESQAMVDVVTRVVDESERVGLLSDDTNLDDLSGSSIAVNDLVLTNEPLASGLSLVHFDGGSADVTFSLSDLPLGQSVTDALTAQDDADSSTDMTAESTVGDAVDFSQSDLALATVERDGTWYVSMGYSIAEAVRSITDLPVPLEAGITPEGFETPEAAATAFWTRFSTDDLGGAISTVAPGEGDALARYAPLWLPEIEQGLADSYGWIQTSNVDAMTFEVTGSGVRRTVTPTAYTITGTTVIVDIGDEEFFLPTFDPNQPTIVDPYFEFGIDEPMSEDDEPGFYLIAAGEPIPDSFDDLERRTMAEPEMVDLFESDISINWAFLDQEGNLVAQWSDEDAAGLEPEVTTEPEVQPFTIEYADGCTTTTGLAQSSWVYGDSTAPSTEPVTSCDDKVSSDPLNVLTSAMSHTVLTDLGVIEIDGRWYVSPIGSVGAVLLDTLADIEDGEALSFNSPLGIFRYGLSPANSMLVGQRIDTMSPACLDVATVDDVGLITGIVDHPDADQLETCMWESEPVTLAESDLTQTYDTTEAGSDTEDATVIDD